MKRTSLAFAFALLTATGFMSATAITAAQAGNDRSPTATVGAKTQGTNAVSRTLVLLRSKISSDNGQVALPAGFSAIDALTTLTCPATRTCVIVATQNVQIRSADANNNWAICTRVNGNFLTNPNCPFLGPVPANTFAANSFAQSSGDLGPGNHTVQTFVFFSVAATRSIYEITYSIYR